MSERFAVASRDGISIDERLRFTEPPGGRFFTLGRA
jgi:hypothetical protein